MMEEKKKVALGTVVLLLMLLWLSMASTALACSSNGGGGRRKNNGGCKDCVVDQMKYGCPPCVPVLRCMARCLWGGTTRSKCINRCDCNGGKPSLSDCKKCMSRCKCSCAAS